jgi:transposase-like protein
MGRTGRPPKGLRHVDHLEGPKESKHRLRVILETLSGTRSVAEACRELEVSEARFHEMRKQALEAALAGLSPGRAGRPPKDRPEEPGRVEELESEVRELEVDLQAALVRTELGMAMPHLLRKEPEFGSKRGRHWAKVRRRNGKDAKK